MKILLFIVTFVLMGWGQTNQLTLQSDGPPPAQGGNATIVGTPGNATYYYWVIAKYPIGNATPLGPIQADNAPNTLSGGNYIKLNWNITRVRAGHYYNFPHPPPLQKTAPPAAVRPQSHWPQTRPHKSPPPPAAAHGENAKGSPAACK